MRRRETSPAAQLVKLFCSAAKGLCCESELGSRSESQDEARTLFFPLFPLRGFT